ncbi:hypothetical protein C5E12_02790 [Rathayibacter rathayi]|nr:hypothetical protein C5E12_02790 [Rathayibacter rathayi]
MFSLHHVVLRTIRISDRRRIFGARPALLSGSSACQACRLSPAVRAQAVFDRLGLSAGHPWELDLPKGEEGHSSPLSRSRCSLGARGGVCRGQLCPAPSLAHTGGVAIKVTLVDDLDGVLAPDGSTVQFSIDDDVYEIDLSPRNRQKLRAAFRPYVDASRRARYRITDLPAVGPKK